MPTAITLVNDSLRVLPASDQLDSDIQQRLNSQTKPPGSLGRLEALAAQVARIQKTLTPSTEPAHHLVFAADHGVVAEQVSPYPQIVTQQMVSNFLSGGAAINVLCRQHEVALTIVDAGLKNPLPGKAPLINRSVGPGTTNFCEHPAMTDQQLTDCLQTGRDIVDSQAAGARVISLGEMGIGNTTAAAALVCALYDWPAQQMVGAGTGAPADMQDHKIQVVSRALQQHRAKLTTPLLIMQHLGGFEIAMMTGAYLRAAALGKLILVDGFIATVAWAVACQLQPALRDYSVFGHRSAEKGHRRLLEQLGARPLLQLDMRLGEGTGALTALPLIRSAVALFNDMATFTEAGIDTP